MLAFAIFLGIVLVLGSVSPVRAATQGEFAATSAAIGSSYAAVLDAANKGGNVSMLVSQLQLSANLVQKASAENPSSPSKATADLQNATAIAQQVSAKAPAIGQAGASARQVQLFVAVASAAAIVVAAGLIYLFGDRLYHRVWLRVHRNHLVEKIG